MLPLTCQIESPKTEMKTRKKRGKGRPFKKGQSGNPKGRPRTGLSIAEHIRQLAGQDGAKYVAVLHRLAIGRHRDTRSRLTSIGLLLERGYGKPAQSVELQAKVEGAMTVRAVPTEQITKYLTNEELSRASVIGAEFEALLNAAAARYEAGKR